jgi:Protein of unknown function (DUF1549)/Protein of unknown function (DUF1553)
LISLGVAALALGLAFSAASVRRSELPRAAVAPSAAAEVDAWLEAEWKRQGLEPAPRVEPLQVLRRLSLAMLGTVPSLEEVRAFEADARADRLERWVAARLDDPRHHRYFAERLARAFVGTHHGSFLIYRRDLLVDWLEAQLGARRPFDALVRDLIASNGLWTGSPATNFVTAGAVEGTIDPEVLAGRTARAFLGVRLDCAQCHDHPFADWKQEQFKGLAAFYQGERATAFGLKLEAPAAARHAPFGAEWLPARGAPREQLAAWVTSPDNPRFGRAVSNRVWGLLFGRPFSDPVDDVPDPGDARTALLDVLGRDFVAHGHDLRRLIAGIATSRAFALSSELPDEALRATHEAAWAVFPLTPLRPEQLVGSALQAANPRTIDRDSHVVVRALRLLREKGFVDEYGDPGEDELAPRAATVAQALLRLNGKLPDELVEPNPFTTVGRSHLLASAPAAALEAVWLAFLARRPTGDELAAFLPRLDVQGAARGKALSDLAWALFNSPEFAWNH